MTFQPQDPQAPNEAPSELHTCGLSFGHEFWTHMPGVQLPVPGLISIGPPALAFGNIRKAARAIAGMASTDTSRLR
jgi:hypothetical protein